MKKTFLTILVVSITCLGFSQKVEENKIGFDYVQFPQEPISKNVTNYQAKVVQAYADAYNQKMKEADAKYNADMAAYEQQVKEAEAKYNADMEAYNKKSLKDKVVEKGLLDQGKPQKQVPTRPTKAPADVSFQKIYNSDVLAGDIKLEGFKSAPTNAVVITITMEGLEYSEPQIKTGYQSKVENGVTRQVPYYFYTVSCRHPMGAKVEVPGTGVIFDEHPAKLAEYKTETTPSFSSEYDLKNYWSKNESFLSTADDKIVNENMQYLSQYLNDKYGYMKKKREFELNSIKEHEGNKYDDYQQAYEAAIAGFNQLTTSKDQAAINIKKAVDLWEAALKESNPHDKKARVNEKITVATLENLAEAYLWLNDFTSSEADLNKLAAMDLSHKDKRELEYNRELMKSQKIRYDALASK